MNERRKLWLSVTAALWTGTGAMVAPALAQEHADGSPSTASEATEPMAHDAPASSTMGESEGGAESSALVADDPAFLVRLGLIRGHLQVGNALYQGGLTEMSATHMKHPRDELYAGLVPAIEARGASTFDDELTALATAVESGKDAAEVQTAWEAVDGAIQAIEIRVDAPLDVHLLAAARVLRTAGEEYAIGAPEGRIANVHEFQDAWGFTQVVERRLVRLEPDTDDARTALQTAQRLVADLNVLWPALAPDHVLEGRASALHGAAARIELLAYGLTRN